jgi:hypothetical protein
LAIGLIKRQKTLWKLSGKIVRWLAHRIRRMHANGWRVKAAGYYAAIGA